MSAQLRAVPSPCTGVCNLDQDGLCLGCHRNVGEITRWTLMGEDERQHLMEHELPRREAQRTS